MTGMHSDLRVLVAGPRPAGLAPMPARSHIEALYDALEAQGDQLKIEWLFPGSLEALAAALAGEGAGAPDVVFLDARLEGDPVVGPLLEADTPAGSVATVDALGATLRQGSASLLVLRAPEARYYLEALAAAAELPIVRLDDRLDEAELRAAATAALAALLAGHTAAEAAEEGRRALREHPARRADAPEPGAAVMLYGAGDSPVLTPGTTGGQGVAKVVRFPGNELHPAWLRLAGDPEEGGLPPEPRHGWIGRGAELVALERAAREEGGNGIAVVHGPHGAGKTALAAHAARWLVRTGRFRQVVYVRYAEGGLAERALHALGARLVGDRFDLRSADATREIERALIETPTLIVWDDLDALLPEGVAPVPAAALDELFALGVHLAGVGATRLWVLSQTAPLPHPGYREGTASRLLPVGGLPAGEAEELAGRAWPVAALTADADAPRRLAWGLGGQPLALLALAPLLERESPAEVEGDLGRILPGYATGEARLRDQAATLVIEALRRSLPEDLQPKLDALGVFAGGMMKPLGANVAELENDTWEQVLSLLLAADLVQQFELRGLAVPLLRFHPALSGHLARRLASALRARALHRHAGAYLGLQKWMAQNAEQHGALVHSLALYELANFRRGLDTLCEAHELNVAAEYAAAWQRFLVELGLRGEHLEAARRLREAVSESVPAEGPLARQGVLFLITQGEQLLSSGRAPEAVAVLQHLAERMEAEGGLSYSGPEVTLDLAQTRRRLGRALVAVGRRDTALSALTRALAAFGEIPGAEARREVMLAHQDIGDAYLAGGQSDDATEAFGRALAVATELDERRVLGALNAQLGTIAMTREDRDAARRYLEAALFHLETLDDAAGMAAIWSQLGVLAWQSSDLGEAERCYQQALALARQAGLPVVEAQTHLQLALTARQADRLGDAEAHYTEASRLYQAHNVRTGLATTEMALAELLLEEGEVEKARVHAEAARAVTEDPRGADDAWAVYALLQRIAAAQGDAERVAHWRARTQESFAHSPEAQQVQQQWRQVIDSVARAGRGEALNSDTVRLLEELEARREWGALVAVIWRILGGERDRALYAELDHVDALVVRSILDAIARPEEEPQAEAPAGAAATEGWPMPLSELMSAVVAGLRGDATARRVVGLAISRMTQPNAPATAQSYARALGRILQGERDEALLEGLPKELSDPLAMLLRALNKANMN